MPTSSDETLRQLALLYLALAHGADDYLSDAELQAVIHQLEQRFDQASVSGPIREIVMDALSAYLEAEQPQELVTAAMLQLRERLSEPEREAYLDDLSHVARADGVVLQDERGVLAALARCWDVDLSEEAISQPLGAGTTVAMADDVMHDLAFIYLVLGHGTDFELSDAETRMMLRRLEEWQPQMGEEQIRAVLEGAMNRYAEGPTEHALNEAIRSVRNRLPHDQRMAALHDLVKIANADGVFLDDEEDLINRLLAEWEVDAYANYGEHGKKSA